MFYRNGSQKEFSSEQFNFCNRDKMRWDISLPPLAPRPLTLPHNYITKTSLPFPFPFPSPFPLLPLYRHHIYLYVCPVLRFNVLFLPQPWTYHWIWGRNHHWQHSMQFPCTAFESMLAARNLRVEKTVAPKMGDTPPLDRVEKNLSQHAHRTKNPVPLIKFPFSFHYTAHRLPASMESASSRLESSFHVITNSSAHS